MLTTGACFDGSLPPQPTENKGFTRPEVSARGEVPPPIAPNPALRFFTPLPPFPAHPPKITRVRYLDHCVSKQRTRFGCTCTCLIQMHVHTAPWRTPAQVPGTENGPHRATRLPQERHPRDVAAWFTVSERSGLRQGESSRSETGEGAKYLRHPVSTCTLSKPRR